MLLHTLIDSLSLKFYVNQRPGFHLSVKQILGKFAKKEMTCKLNAFPPNDWSGQTTPVKAASPNVSLKDVNVQVPSWK